MDPFTIALLSLGIINTTLQASRQAGLLGDAGKAAGYADAGLFVAGQAAQIIAELKAGSTAYDSLTPDEIKARLAPSGWDELEAQARAELGLPPSE